MALLDASTLLEPVVKEALSSLELPPSDAALVGLAVAYARAIDTDAFEGGVALALEKLGPKLQTALDACLASAASRARSKAPVTSGEIPGAAALRSLRGGA